MNPFVDGDLRLNLYQAALVKEKTPGDSCVETAVCGRAC